MCKSRPLRRPASFFAGADRSDFLVLPIGDEVVDDGGIGQRRGIAEVGEIVLGDLAQNAAHDLAGTGLGQAGCELDEVGRGDRTDLVADVLDQFLLQVVARRPRRPFKVT